MPRSTIRWPKWSQIFSAWSAHEVPPVEVVPYQLEKHFPRLPWIHKQSGRQHIEYSPPREETAAILCVRLAGAKPELLAACKLNAYCLSERLSGFRTEVLGDVYGRHGSHLSHWWHPNARYVLPPCSARFLDIGELYAEQAKRWREIVEGAANAWKDIAATWAIVRIPAFMDHQSPEYEQYVQYEVRLSDERERQEYERLRKKFGP